MYSNAFPILSLNVWEIHNPWLRMLVAAVALEAQSIPEHSFPHSPGKAGESILSLMSPTMV